MLVRCIKRTAVSGQFHEPGDALDVEPVLAGRLLEAGYVIDASREVEAAVDDAATETADSYYTPPQKVRRGRKPKGG